jgi:hypothetical protein
VLGYGDAPSTDFSSFCSLGANAAAKGIYRATRTIQTGGINLTQAYIRQDGAGRRRETAHACP